MPGNNLKIQRTEGWLFKKTAGKGWQKRYFVLQPDLRSLSYFCELQGWCHSLYVCVQLQTGRS